MFSERMPLANVFDDINCDFLIRNVTDIREAFALRAFVFAHQLLRNILPFSSPLLTSLT
jgi:hypothetical protein